MKFGQTTQVEAYLRLVFLLLGAAVVALFLFNYVSTNGRKSKAAVGPDGVNITFAKVADGSTETLQKIGVTIRPVTTTNKISAFNLILTTSGAAKISGATKPAGFADELFFQPTANPARFTYTVGTSGAPQEMVYFILDVQKDGTSNAGTITLDKQKSEVVGTLNKITYDLDSDPIAHTVTFDGTNTTPGVTQTVTPTITQVVTPSMTPTVPPTITATVTPTVPPTVTPTLTPTPPSGSVSMTLNLSLRLQGITTMPKLTDAEPFKLQIRGAANINTTVSMKPGEGGVYTGTTTISAPEGSTYRIYVKGPRHIQKKICANSPGETAIGTYRCDGGAISLKAGTNTLNFSGISLLVGDLPNQDGVVDSYDTSFVRQSIGSTDGAKLSVGDINRDGVVDTQDLSLIIQALNVKFDEE